MKHSNVAYQVMWNRLISVVEEQAQALVRTAFSTSVREAGDLSAGVYDVKGQMLAQAVTGTPGHVNAMADAVAHFIRRIGTDNIFEGDIYITNDPWEGTGHLHDITMVTPSFYKKELILSLILLDFINDSPIKKVLILVFLQIWRISILELINIFLTFRFESLHHC